MRAHTLRVFAFCVASSLPLSACGGGSPGPVIPVPTPKGSVGLSAGWNLTVLNNTRSGPEFPITVTLYTNCFYDQPPWSYTIQPEATATFNLSAVNYSGSCLTESSYGSVTITNASGSTLDTIGFGWMSAESAVVVNCGGKTVESPIGDSYTYIYNGLSLQPTCLY